MASSSSEIITSQPASQLRTTRRPLAVPTTSLGDDALPLTQCFPITNAIYLNDFEGAYMRCVTHQTCNTSSLEALLSSSFFVDASADDLVRKLQMESGCPGSDFNVRYMASVSLGLFVQTSQNPARDDFRCPPNPPNIKMVCRSTCLTYSESIQTSYNNTAVCQPESELTIYQKEIRLAYTAFAKHCYRLPESDCLPFLSLDRGSCGFMNPEQASVYCRRGGLGELRNDNCCLQLTGRFAEALARDPKGRGNFTATAVPTSLGGGAGSSGSGSVPVAAIAVPLVLVALAAAVVAVVLVLRRGRRGKRELQVPVEVSSNDFDSRRSRGNASTENLTLSLAGAPFLTAPSNNRRSLTSEISPADSSSDVSQWNANQVSRWLLSSGFDQSIANILLAGNVDGRKLLDLNDDSLGALGVQAPGVSTMLLLAVDALRTGDSLAASRNG
ncbi:hypothetical protein HDU96_009511 [Phlyctochytrium bullatum]|nr:hypothetical protein HDU96_009511 [Phlyctochytrium bullatum]